MGIIYFYYPKIKIKFRRTEKRCSLYTDDLALLVNCESGALYVAYTHIVHTHTVCLPYIDFHSFLFISAA